MTSNHILNKLHTIYTLSVNNELEEEAQGDTQDIPKLCSRDSLEDEANWKGDEKAND